MYLAEKVHNVVRGLVQRYGPQTLKRRLWNAEFSAGRWDYLDKKGQDSVHHEIEKYANQGAVLDLGCGWGNIGIELKPSAYSFYTGVDISDIVIEKARNKAISTGRADRNEYRQSDILTFLPERQYTVILFGDSIYYVPLAQIIPLLKRYSQYIDNAGVFIVRIFDARGKLRRIVDLIESHFEVVDKNSPEDMNACIVVFRPPLRKASISQRVLS
jgi:2-polyprenyl-3-methyl-5-hydroxy-6-metoxy-1,4-benzoquinol methylase